MLVKLIFEPIFALLGFIISLLPSFSYDQSTFDISGLLDMLISAFIFFPLPLFITIIGNVVFWLDVQVVWAVIEWCYKKIPGVS